MAKRVALTARALAVGAAEVGKPSLVERSGWVVYFEDGTKFSSMDGAPNAAPFKRVLCIAIRPGRYTLWGAEWFYFDTGLGGWQASDTVGLLARLCLDASAIGIVRKGAPISDELEVAMQRALIERTT